MSEGGTAERERSGRVEGYVVRDLLHKGLVTSFAEALRVGVPVERLDLSRLPNTWRVAGLAATPPAVLALEGRIAELSSRIDDCFLRQGRATAGSVQEEAARAEGAALKSERAAVEEELASVHRALAGPGHKDQADAFVAETAMLKRAIGALLGSDGRVTSDQAAALDQVLAELSLEPGAGQWACRARWRVPLVDGVGLVGPIAFSVPMPSAQRTGIVLRRNLERGGVGEGSPAFDVARLMELGMTRKAALTALDSPLEMLVPALLHKLTSAEMPAAASSEWRDEAFLDWLVHVYADQAFAWTVPGYTIVPYGDQSVVNALVDLGGVADGRQLSELVPRMDNTRLATESARLNPMWTGVRAYSPPTSVFQQSRKGDRGRGARFELFMCECGETLTHVVCAPEVPRRLLCTCGRMPDMPDGGERWNAPSDVRFPPDYLRLSPTRDQITTFQRRERPRQQQAVWVGTVVRAVLNLPGLRAPLEMSTPEIAVAVNTTVSSLVTTLRTMQRNGLIESRRQEIPEGMRGQLPRMWTITSDDPLEGRKVIEFGLPVPPGDRRLKRRVARPTMPAADGS